jgi:hypothetical protein
MDLDHSFSMTNITRRRLLSITANVMTATAIVGPYLPGMVFAQDGSPEDINPEALATLVHDIFPHDDIAPEVYTGIARTIIAGEQGAAGDPELIRAGLRQLDELAGAVWWRMDEGRRLPALNRIAGGEFFQSILQKSRSLLYLRPEVWRLVGYGGNALAQGGYLTRGFDDIDWLN